MYRKVDGNDQKFKKLEIITITQAYTKLELEK